MIFPPPPQSLPADQRTYLQQLTRAIDQADRETLKRNVGTQQVLLVSPGGSVYSVQVTDAGALTTTQVA